MGLFHLCSGIFWKCVLSGDSVCSPAKDLSQFLPNHSCSLVHTAEGPWGKTLKCLCHTRYFSMVSWFIPNMMGFLATPTKMQHAGSAHILANCSAISLPSISPNSATFSQLQKEPMAVPGQFRTDLVILESFNHCLSVCLSDRIQTFLFS